MGGVTHGHASFKFWSFYCKTWYSEYSKWLRPVAFLQLQSAPNSAGLHSALHCGSLTALPRPSSWFKGPYFWGGVEEREGNEIYEGGGGKGRMEGTGPPFANFWIRPCVQPTLHDHQHLLSVNVGNDALVYSQRAPNMHIWANHSRENRSRFINIHIVIIISETYSRFRQSLKTFLFGHYLTTVHGAVWSSVQLRYLHHLFSYLLTYLFTYLHDKQRWLVAVSLSRRIHVLAKISENGHKKITLTPQNPRQE